MWSRARVIFLSACKAEFLYVFNGARCQRVWFHAFEFKHVVLCERRKKCKWFTRKRRFLLSWIAGHGRWRSVCVWRIWMWRFWNDVKDLEVPTRVKKKTSHCEKLSKNGSYRQWSSSSGGSSNTKRRGPGRGKRENGGADHTSHDEQGGADAAGFDTGREMAMRAVILAFKADLEIIEGGGGGGRGWRCRAMISS